MGTGCASRFCRSMLERIFRALKRRLIIYSIAGAISGLTAAYRHFIAPIAAARAAEPSSPALAAPQPSPLQAEYAALVEARQKLDVNDHEAVIKFNEQVAKYAADRTAAAKLL